MPTINAAAPTTGAHVTMKWSRSSAAASSSLIPDSAALSSAGAAKKFTMPPIIGIELIVAFVLSAVARVGYFAASLLTSP